MKQHRVINKLIWASPLASKPSCIPNSRPRGAKAAGLRFERGLAKHLPEAVHGQWFEYRDASGLGYCQTDLLFPYLPQFMAVLEVKYTLVPNAFAKLVDFYLPIVRAATNLPVVGVVVVRNLEAALISGAAIFSDLPTAAEMAHINKYPTILHWRGQNLLPSPRKSLLKAA